MTQQIFNINSAKSSVLWTGRKITGEHTGSIGIASGSITVSDGNIEQARVEMDMRSITISDIADPVTNQQFAGHLASDDFFSSEKFPTAGFQAMNVVKTGPDRVTVIGNLTIKGITHSESFDATVSFSGSELSIKGTASIDRTKYDMRFRSGNFFQNLGDTLIYNDFKLDLSITALN